MGNAKSDMQKIDNWFKDDVKNFIVKDMGKIVNDIKNDSVFKDITKSFGSVVSGGVTGISALFGNVLNSANKLVTAGGSLLNGTTFYLVLGVLGVGGIIYLTRK